MQSVPRIVIRTSTPMTQPEQPKQNPPPQPPSQQPVVLNSRVVQDSGAATPEPPGGYAHAYTPYPLPQQHQAQQLPQQLPQQQQHAQGPYGMHQYQQAAQHHQQQPAPYQGHSSAISSHQQSVPHYQLPTQQLPQQSQQQLPQQQQQQQQQKLPQQVQQEQQQQRMPRPGSFQELLSAPVLPERYNSAPLPHDHPSSAPSLAPVQQQQQQQQMTQVPAAQATSMYSGQVVHGPVLTSQGIGSEQLQYSYAPTHVPRAQQMTPARTDAGQPQSIHAYRQQQQQQMAGPQHVGMGGLPSSSAQYPPSQTSSCMYPPMQFPAQHGAGGSQPMQMLYGHPYHGQSSQGMGQQMFPLQQQQQLPLQLQSQQQPVHPQGQQPLQQGQQPYAHGPVMNAPDPSAHAAFRSSSGFLIPPPVGQLFQSADGPYSSAVQSLDQRSHSFSSQSGSYQSGHTSHESAAANAAQSQHQAVPSVGIHQRQEQPKQQQNFASQPQHSFQAVYQHQQQQQQLPASTQAGGVLSQSPGGLVWRGIPGPAPGAPVPAGSGPMMCAGFSGMQQQPAQQMPGDLSFWF